MNIYQELDKLVEYIETNLFGEIDIKAFAKKQGFTPYVLNYIFSAVAEMSISSYIKKRRLTLAVNLLEKNKVIDVALASGYNSPESFSRAFKSFHGFSPSQARQSSQFSICGRLSFSQKETEKANFKAKLINIDKMTFYGEKIDVYYSENVSKKIRNFWQKTYALHPSLRNEKEIMGIVLYYKGGFEYYIALSQPYSQSCKRIDIKAHQYLSVCIENYDAAQINAYSEDIKDNFSQDQTTPDIEIYRGNDVEILFGTKKVQD